MCVLMIADTRDVYVFGENAYGQLGVYDTNARSLPVPVSMVNVNGIGAGGSSSYAIQGEGGCGVV